MGKRAVPSDAERQALTADAWLATLAAANTRAAYRTDLETFGRWCAGNQVIPLKADTAALATYLAARVAAGDSDATLRRRWSSLSSFYRFAAGMGATGSNPVEGLSRPTTMPGNPSPTATLTSAAVERYLVMAAGLDPRLEALISLLVYDGLKLGEALELDVDDVSGRPPNVSLLLRRDGSARRVVLRSATGRAVQRCAKNRRGEPLFTSGRPAAESAPRRLTRFGADHLIRQLSGDGEERVTANAFRRFHFTSSAAAGVDEDEARQRAGLQSVRSLRRYVPVV